MDIKNVFKIISTTVLLTLTSFGLFAASPPPLKTVLITQITSHPSADAVRQGVLAGLKDGGFIDGKNITVTIANAHGNTTTAMQIAKKFVSLKPDLMIPITTPSTQAIIQANEEFKYPVVFAAVTDPVGAGIVKSLQNPGGSVTGSTDAAPLKHQFEIFKQILPNIKTLGILYNPGDNSSATPVKEAKELAKQMGWTIIEATSPKTGDVPAAMQKLVGDKVDAVFVPLDNTVLSAMDSVVKIGNEAKIPVLSSDSDSVGQGALVSSGYTHFSTGYAAGFLASRVLKGENPSNIPIANAQDLNIYVNLKSAEKLGIKISPEILKTAQKL